MKNVTKYGLALCLSLLLSAGSAFGITEEQIMQQVATAWQSQDYAGVYSVADQWLSAVESGELPDIGPSYAQIAFLVGFSGYKLDEAGEMNFTPDVYKRTVVEPIEGALRINQQDFTTRIQILSRAYKRLYDLQEDKSQETENKTVWTLWRAVIEQQKKDGWVKPVSQQTAGLLYQYIQFCIDIVPETEYPDLYRYRIRHACETGFGASPRFDSAFWIYYDMTFFDEGNILAGVLYQKGNEHTYNEADEEIQKANNFFKSALDVARTNKAKAEIYRQMADNLATVGGEKYMDEANIHARAAYRLLPYDKDIRDLYGSTLFALAQKSFRDKQYMKVQRLAQEGTSFVNAFDYEHYLFLARVQAFQGMKIEAIRNGRTAYLKACNQASASDLEFFADTYRSILQQFGEGDKFRPCPGRK